MTDIARMENLRHRATITSRREDARDTFEVTFEVEGGLRYEAGQYLWLIFPTLIANDPRGSRRAFSICNPPSVEGLTREVVILFRNSESGFKQTLIRAPIGESVFIEAPFGSAFVLSPELRSYRSPTNEQGRVVLIAGGVGISCFLAHLRSSDIVSSHVVSALVYFNTSLDRACFMGELQAITSASHIAFHNALGDFKPEYIFKDIDVARDQFFICGPQGFVDAIYLALLVLGVSEDRMVFEENRPSTPTTFTV